jgi:predicted RND superfamily exporter protein
MPNLLQRLLTSISGGTLREAIEQRFGEWGHTVYRHRWLVMAAIVAFTAALASQLPRIEVDTSSEGFLYDNDPVRVRYDQFRQQFANDNITMIAIEGDNVFDPRFLAHLKEFHEELAREVPYLDEVDSLINARETVGNEEGLVVGEFLETWPETPEALAERKQAALANPFYVGTYLSADGKVAAIHVKNQVFIANESDALSGFEESNSNAPLEKLGSAREFEIFTILKRLIDKHNSPEFRIYALGGAFDAAWFLNMVSEEMNLFTLLSIITIAILLAVIFRRVVMVFLPLSVSLLAMMATMSIMAMAGIKVSFSMQIVPAFLLAVGVGNSVHLFTSFFRILESGESKQDALAHAMQHSGLAIVMTAITTAGGLLSFLSSPLKPVAEFGIIAPLGVMLALLYTLVLLPALIAIVPIRNKTREADNHPFIRQTLVKTGDFAVNHAGKVVLGWFVIIGLGLFFALQIGFSFFPYKNLPEDHFLRLSIEKFDASMGGSAPLEFVIDTGKENGIKDPAVLKLIDEFQQYAVEKKYDQIDIAKATSIIDVTKELHQALNENRPEFYAIPDDPEVIAQELLLFESSGADDLQILVDPAFSKARVTLSVSLQDGIYYQPVITDLKQKLTTLFQGRAEVSSTGIIDIMFSIFVQISYSLALSYAIAFIIITPCMVLLIGSLRIGLISMIPNVAPIIITLGMMTLADLKLTTATLLTGSIALGLVVDDTIHFLHNFQRYYHRGADVATAVRQTLDTTGVALLISTVVLSLTFLIFVMNTLSDWAAFGIVTSFCLVVAFFADIILTPALLTLLARHNLLRR